MKAVHFYPFFRMRDFDSLQASFWLIIALVCPISQLLGSAFAKHPDLCRNFSISGVLVRVASLVYNCLFRSVIVDSSLPAKPAAEHVSAAQLHSQLKSHFCESLRVARGILPLFWAAIFPPRSRKLHHSHFDEFSCPGIGASVCEG